MIYAVDFSQFLTTDLAPEVFSSLCVIGIICILCIIICIKANHHNPLKKTTGLLYIAEFGVTYFEDFVVGLAGERFRSLGGFIMGVATYLFLAFIFGLTGLPSPMTYIAVPLSLGLTTFVMIHATSVKYSKWGYFKRFVDPFPVFLPVNLLSMWAPLLSLTLRLFGNAVAGWTLMNVLYYALEKLSSKLFSFLSATFPDGSQINEVFIAPFLTPVLHAYFDLFSGFIQTVVFISLTVLFIAQEAPEEDF